MFDDEDGEAIYAIEDIPIGCEVKFACEEEGEWNEVVEVIPQGDHEATVVFKGPTNKSGHGHDYWYWPDEELKFRKKHPAPVVTVAYEEVDRKDVRKQLNGILPLEIRFKIWKSNEWYAVTHVDESQAHFQRSGTDCSLFYNADTNVIFRRPILRFLPVRAEDVDPTLIGA